MSTPIADFLAALNASLDAQQCLGLSLSRYRGDEPELKKLLIKPALIKRQLQLSFTWRHAQRDIIKNHPREQAIAQLGELLEQTFGAATLFTTEADWVLDCAPGKPARLRRTAPSKTSAPQLAHDRSKQRAVADTRRPYLQALKLADAQGTVFKNAQDKFRQISRYIELLDPLLDALPPGPLSIVDMGSGKGYLTFALYDHLRHTRQREVRITGIEYREDLVNLCNRIAAQCDYTQLAFLRGSIADYPQADADVVIALHACDTATDDAIAQGIRAGAQLIVVAPCCHKQIRRAMQAGNSPHPLSFVTRHGIFMERQAEMITDALRALILERHGYKTRAFEFVSDAHTAKNVLVVAQRRATPPDTGQLRALQQQIDDAKKLFGIGQHYLETLV